MSIKKQRRKSSSAVVYLPIAALLILLLCVFGVSAFLHIVEIEVLGASMYSSAEIINASGIKIGDNILFVSTSDAEQRIYSALPYINEVNIDFTFPDTVTINIKESTAIAAMYYRGAVLKIDSAGRALELIDNIPAGLIEIIGFTSAEVELGNILRAQSGSETRLRSMIDVLTALETEGLHRGVSYVDVSNIANINFRYVDRFTVVLDDTGSIAHSINRLHGAFERLDTMRSANATGTFRRTDATGEWVFSEDP